MFDEHWTEAEIAALNKARSFRELSETGVVIAERMKQAHNVVVMCIGPMTTGGLGDLSRNMDRFRRAIDFAKTKYLSTGSNVFNQAVFQQKMIELIAASLRPPQAYVQELLDEFYRPVFATRHIDGFLYFPDWDTSYGARWEVEVSREYGIHLFPYPPNWWEELHR
jgi:hypothetical protein